MNPTTIVCYVGILASSMFAITQATVGGQYAVNVHFVPPLVTAPCSIAQVWSPQNVTCAMCFCITGTLSRCVPQPGCNPNAPNNGTTTTTTQAPVDESPTEQVNGPAAPSEGAVTTTETSGTNTTASPAVSGIEKKIHKLGKPKRRSNSIFRS